MKGGDLREEGAATAEVAHAPTAAEARLRERQGARAERRGRHGERTGLCFF